MAIQILPTAPGFSQGLGQGLVNTLVPQFQQQYQRNMVKQSMNEVKDLAKNPDATAFDLASALISSTAGVPGAEKYIGQLFPILNDQLQQQRSLKNSPLGDMGNMTGGGQNLTAQAREIQKTNTKGSPKLKAGGVPEEGEGEGEEGAEPAMPSVFQILPPENYNPATAEPGQVPRMKLPYPDPQAYNMIRQKARQQRYTPQMVEQFVNEAKEANEAARNAYTFEQVQYNQLQQEKQDYLKNSQEIEKYIGDNAKEFGDPDNKQLALQIAENISSTQGGSPQQVLTKTKEQLRPYQQAVDSLKKNKRPLFGQTKNQQDKLKEDVKVMVNMGQKHKLRLILAANGYGDVEEAKLLNDLPDNLQNYFKKRDEKKERFANPQDSIPPMILTEPDSPEYLKYFNKGLEKREKQVGEVEDYLSKNFTSGDYKNPGTNLLLIRKNLQNQGMTWEEAGITIRNVVNKKLAEDPNFKLDSHQTNDSMKLAYPPLSGESFLKNQLQYWFFGKE